MPIGALFSGAQALAQAKTQAMNVGTQQAREIASGASQSATVSALAQMYSGWTGSASAPATVVTPRKDPFVLASEIAASQPKDKAWRLLDGVLFKVEHVAHVSLLPTYADSSLDNVNVRFSAKKGDLVSEWAHTFSLPIDVPDKTKWFAEHVLGFEFNNSP